MANTTTIKKVRTDLRIVSTTLDSDISDQIDSCLADLTMCGIPEPYEDDPLILNAIKLWCRANITTDTAKSAVYMERYNAMKGSLQVAANYGGYNGDD